MTTTTIPTAGELRLALDDIRVRENVRDLDVEHVESLARSIALRGLLVPLIVRVVDDGHELVAGYHRVAACRKLGLSDAPVVVRDHEGSSADSAAENVTSCRRRHDVTFSHLLLQSLAMRCGYPASSIRERIYVDTAGGRYGLMLYTASPDAEGTLGGLVGQARDIEAHLAVGLRSGGLCSNDPVCAQHTPGEGFEGRSLHGAACHGCSLIAETSCEMRNDYLDRALVGPTLAGAGAAFFPAVQ